MIFPVDGPEVNQVFPAFISDAYNFPQDVKWFISMENQISSLIFIYLFIF